MAKSNENNMVVKNEFDRLLKTSTDVIMSEGLQEMLSPKELQPEIETSCAILISRAGKDTSPTRFDCTFNSLSKVNTDSYRLELHFQNAQEFLSKLQPIEKLSIRAVGDLGFSFNDCHVGSWDLFRDATGFMIGLEISGNVEL